MTEHTVQMDAELSSDSVVIFHAVEIMLPGGPLRLLDGSHELTLDGHVFSGSHPTYGVLGQIDGLDDGVDAEISELTLTFIPPSAADAVLLASAEAQGSAIRVWKGAINKQTGSVTPAPKRLFEGTVDVPTLQGDEGVMSLTFTATAETDRLFDADEGIRLSDAFLQSMWDGDLGCAFVTGVQDQMPWGDEARVPASVNAVNTGGGFGGGIDLTNFAGF